MVQKIVLCVISAKQTKDVLWNNKTNKKTIRIMAEVMENMHHEYASKGKANAGLTLGRQ